MCHTKKKKVHVRILAFKQIMNLNIMINIRNAQLLDSHGQVEDLTPAGL